jgi:hypothetical protein
MTIEAALFRPGLDILVLRKASAQSCFGSTRSERTRSSASALTNAARKSRQQLMGPIQCGTKENTLLA